MNNRFLLQLLEPNPSHPNPDWLRAFTKEEWDSLIDEAIHFRLAFQFNEYLKANANLLELISETSLNRLKDSLRFIVMNNLRNQAQLISMLLGCAKADIPVILIKGLWLVETIYRNSQARASGDIDLLLSPSDIPRFTCLVREMGFDFPLDITDIRDTAVGRNEFQFTHPVTKARFDVHWSLTDPMEVPSVDEGSFWHRSEIVTIANMPCRSLCLEDHLLYICFHVAIHHQFLYVGPRALADIAMIMARPPRPIDWDDFLERAYQLGWTRGVWLILDLVREHVGVTPPSSVLDGLRPVDGVNPLIRQAAMKMLFHSQQHNRIMNLNVVRVLTQKTLHGRIAFLFEKFFPSRQAIAIEYRVNNDDPGILWLYLKRWSAMFKRILPTLFQLLLRDAHRRDELENSIMIMEWVQQEMSPKV